jgi:hypothetical protein
VFNLVSHHWEDAKVTLTFSPPGFLQQNPITEPGYVHGGQLGIQAAIQERSSVLYTGSISDWIGPSEGIAFVGDVERERE